MKSHTSSSCRRPRHRRREHRLPQRADDEWGTKHSAVTTKGRASRFVRCSRRQQRAHGRVHGLSGALVARWLRQHSLPTSREHVATTTIATYAALWTLPPSTARAWLAASSRRASSRNNASLRDGVEDADELAATMKSKTRLPTPPKPTAKILPCTSGRASDRKERGARMASTRCR